MKNTLLPILWSINDHVLRRCHINVCLRLQLWNVYFIVPLYRFERFTFDFCNPPLFFWPRPSNAENSDIISHFAFRWHSISHAVFFFKWPVFYALYTESAIGKPVLATSLRISSFFLWRHRELHNTIWTSIYKLAQQYTLGCTWASVNTNARRRHYMPRSNLLFATDVKSGPRAISKRSIYFRRMHLLK